jgi:hypothetical protein
MADLCNDVEKKLDLRLFIDPALLKKAIRFVDIRNTIVHNRGKVNNHLIQRQPDYANALGRSIAIDSTDVIDHSKMLGEAAKDIDHRAIIKFSITREINSPLFVAQSRDALIAKG